jgi:hypothetical protein
MINFDFLIFPLITANIFLPVYGMAMGEFDRKWKFIFCLLVPFGIIWYMLVTGIWGMTSGLIYQWKKTKW